MHHVRVFARFAALLVLLATPLPASAADADKWAAEENVVVIQRLPYERSGRWAVAPFVAVIPNDPFVTYFPVGVRIGHYLNESFLLELSSSYMDALTMDRDLRARVGSTEEDSGSVKLQDHQVARAQVSAAWTLLSAKGRWFGDDLLYVRGHLLGGFGAALARDATDDLDPRPEGLFGVGFEAHLSEAASVRVEWRQSVFQREGGGALFPTELSVGYVWYPGGALGGVR